MIEEIEEIEPQRHREEKTERKILDGNRQLNHDDFRYLLFQNTFSIFLLCVSVVQSGFSFNLLKPPCRNVVRHVPGVICLGAHHLTDFLECLPPDGDVIELAFRIADRVPDLK